METEIGFLRQQLSCFWPFRKIHLEW